MIFNIAKTNNHITSFKFYIAFIQLAILFCTTCEYAVFMKAI